MVRTRVGRAVFALVLLGLAATAVGCGDQELNSGSAGGSKGPEMVTTMESGRPGSASASSMAQSPQLPGTIPYPTAASSCRPDGACLGAGGCAGICDPDAAVLIACARCAEGVFTDCSEQPCTPTR